MRPIHLLSRSPAYNGHIMGNERRHRTRTYASRLTNGRMTSPETRLRFESSPVCCRPIRLYCGTERAYQMTNSMISGEKTIYNACALSFSVRFQIACESNRLSVTGGGESERRLETGSLTLHTKLKTSTALNHLGV